MKQVCTLSKFSGAVPVGGASPRSSASNAGTSAGVLSSIGAFVSPAPRRVPFSDSVMTRKGISIAPISPGLRRTEVDERPATRTVAPEATLRGMTAAV